jgi:hypothetical protein
MIKEQGASFYLHLGGRSFEQLPKAYSHCDLHRPRVHQQNATIAISFSKTKEGHVSETCRTPSMEPPRPAILSVSGDDFLVLHCRDVGVVVHPRARLQVDSIEHDRLEAKLNEDHSHQLMRKDLH